MSPTQAKLTGMKGGEHRGTGNDLIMDKGNGERMKAVGRDRHKQAIRPRESQRHRNPNALKGPCLSKKEDKISRQLSADEKVARGRSRFVLDLTEECDTSR